MIASTLTASSPAHDKRLQLGLMQTLHSPGTARAPQIIPEWAIDHLGKKVRFFEPYFDGCRTWSPEQVGTLDGFLVGESGVECVVSFDDYDGQGYFSAPAVFFMPVNDCPSRHTTGDTIPASVAKPRFHSFILGLVVEVLFRARVDATTAQKTIAKHFTFK